MSSDNINEQAEAEAPVDPDNAGLRNANRVRHPEWTSWETVEQNSLTLLQEQARRISGYIIILAIRPWDINEPTQGLQAVELKVWQGSCDGPEGPKHLVDAGFTHYFILREQVVQ